MEIRIRQSIKIASAKTDVFIKCSGYPQKLCKSEHSRGIEFAHIDSKTVGRGFESSCPCHDAWSKSIRPRKKEKSGDFERFLRFFRACLFSNLYRSIFDFSSSRRDRTTENTLFGEFNNEHKRPEGLEPTTGFQILPVFCVRHKMFTNSALQKHSIPSVGGSEPTKQLKTTFSKSLHRLGKRIRTTENQILHR